MSSRLAPANCLKSIVEHIVTCLPTKHNHCREKHGWYISLQKNQAGAMVPKHFLQAYSRMME